MTKLSTKLSANLDDALKAADEIWMAIALLNLKGLDFILQTIKKDCKVNFVGGVDLPTDPEALKKILSLKENANRSVTAYVLTSEFYHPKVYIIKADNQLKSFIGSANCTNGGLNDNIEMTLEVDNQEISKQLLDWFKTIQESSQTLTADFIENYRPRYKSRLKRRRLDQAEIKAFKESEKEKAEAHFKERALLVSKLKKIRKSAVYSKLKKERQSKIEELKKALDYPNFKKLDLPSFFRIKELGTIVPIRVKGHINKDRLKFAKLMKYICDDTIDINKRVDEALKGKLSIKNISEGFISKILVIHNPSEYYIHNKEFTERLRQFGLSFARGLSFGNKYRLTRDALKLILVETGIDDFAVLDDCLIQL